MSWFKVQIQASKFEVNSDESDDHIREVSLLVQRKIDSALKKNPELSNVKVALLVALELASESVRRIKSSDEFRNTMIHQHLVTQEKIGLLRDRIESI